MDEQHRKIQKKKRQHTNLMNGWRERRWNVSDKKKGKKMVGDNVEREKKNRGRIEGENVREGEREGGRK